MFSNLSISIPSYERHEAIERNIIDNLDCFLKKKLKYIFDDSSSDKLKTKSKIHKIYPYIEYSRIRKLLDMIKIFQAINSESEFIWVIGDSTIIDPKTFTEILKVIQATQT